MSSEQSRKLLPEQELQNAVININLQVRLIQNSMINPALPRNSLSVELNNINVQVKFEQLREILRFADNSI